MPRTGSSSHAASTEQDAAMAEVASPFTSFLLASEACGSRIEVSIISTYFCDQTPGESWATDVYLSHVEKWSVRKIRLPVSFLRL